MTKIKIVYQHVNWLLCYKPAGLDFHDDQGTLGFVSIMRKQLNSTELWPVHRLDKPTSGLILLARSKASCTVLSELFANKEIEKFYLAICPSSLKKKQGKVVGDMAKSRRGCFKLLKTSNNPAITQFFSLAAQAGLRLCLLKPKTGKTHQLRVMLKSLGAAIIGDQAYAAKSSDRLYLHAYAIRFQYQGEYFEFVEKPNSGELFQGIEIEQALENWLQPWQLNWPK